MSRSHAAPTGWSFSAVSDLTGDIDFLVAGRPTSQSASLKSFRITFTASKDSSPCNATGFTVAVPRLRQESGFNFRARVANSFPIRLIKAAGGNSLSPAFTFTTAGADFSSVTGFGEPSAAAGFAVISPDAKGFLGEMNFGSNVCLLTR